MPLPKSRCISYDGHIVRPNNRKCFSSNISELAYDKDMNLICGLNILEYGSVFWDSHCVDAGRRLENFFIFLVTPYEFPILHMIISQFLPNLIQLLWPIVVILLTFIFSRIIISGAIDSPALLSQIHFKVSPHPHVSLAENILSTCSFLLNSLYFQWINLPDYAISQYDDGPLFFSI